MTPYHCSRCGEAMHSMTALGICLKCTVATTDPFPTQAGFRNTPICRRCEDPCDSIGGLCKDCEYRDRSLFDKLNNISRHNTDPQNQIPIEEQERYEAEVIAKKAAEKREHWRYTFAGQIVAANFVHGNDCDLERVVAIADLLLAELEKEKI